MRMSGFVISRRHLEGLRFHSTQIGKLASGILFCNAKHESAYCAIQTGMIKQERIKRTDFRTCTKVKHVLVSAVYHA